MTTKRLLTGTYRKTFLTTGAVAVAVGSAFFVGPLTNASAAPWDNMVGQVVVTATGQRVPAGEEPSYDRAKSTGWSLAWDKCTADYPDTHSIYLDPQSFHTTNRKHVTNIVDEYDEVDIVSGWVCSSQT